MDFSFQIFDFYILLGVAFRDALLFFILKKGTFSLLYMDILVG